MGMSYDDFGVYGRLCKIVCFGLVVMFKCLYIVEWVDRGFFVSEIVEKVKKFFFFYLCNRYKMIMFMLLYYVENYLLDDNRFD